MTASHALAELRSRGLVEIRPGAGAFVRTRAPKSPQKEQLRIGLAYLDAHASHPDVADGAHPLFIQWMRGLQDHFGFERAVIKPLCYQRDGLLDSEGPVRKAIEGRLIDGLLISGATSSSEVEHLQNTSFPCVRVSYDLSEPRIARAEVDYTVGFRHLMRHLGDLGHRRILLLAYRAGQEAWNRLRQRYVDVARAAGFGAFSTEEILALRNDRGPIPGADVEALVGRALERRPTALVVQDEVLAVRTMAHCMKKEIRIPHDLSLAALANAMPGSQVMALTSTNAFEMIREAVRLGAELLERAMGGEDIRGQRIVVAPTLVGGDTTASVPVGRTVESPGRS